MACESLDRESRGAISTGVALLQKKINEVEAIIAALRGVEPEDAA